MKDLKKIAKSRIETNAVGDYAEFYLKDIEQLILEREKEAKEAEKSKFNREHHLLVIKDRKTSEVIDSLQLVLVEENGEDIVRVAYKGNVSVESKKNKLISNKKDK